MDIITQKQLANETKDVIEKYLDGKYNNETLSDNDKKLYNNYKRLTDIIENTEDDNEFISALSELIDLLTDVCMDFMTEEDYYDLVDYKRLLLNFTALMIKSLEKLEYREE